MANDRSRLTGNGHGLLIAVLGASALLTIAILMLAATFVYRLIDEQMRTDAAGRAPPPVVAIRPLPPVPVGVTPVTPIGNQGDWFPPDAYPPAARRAGEQGRVSVALLVGADGRAQACEVTASSGSATLDEATCRLAARNARFTPARDARGVAIPARFALRNVVWRLES